MRVYNNSPSAHDYLTPAVKFLMISNIIAFIIYAITTKYGTSFINDYFVLTPIKLVENMMVWQLVTYSFLHDPFSLSHIFFNLLALFFFGHVVERYFGTKRFYICYFCCAIFSGLVHCVDMYLFKSSFVGVVGASGAIMGILMVTACIIPDMTVYFMFFIPMQMRTLVWIIIFINLYSAFMFTSSNVAASGHLGGLACGYLFFVYGTRIMNWLDKVENIMAKQQEVQGEKKYKNMRSKVDDLLDKINSKGMHSLSNEEKEFLKKASKDYRGP